MFPAARIGDLITHDLLTPCGVIVPSPACACARPVIIEGLPAAHVTCGAVCAGVVTGGIVHPPASPLPILSGSRTVFIHFLPAARWFPALDLVPCGVFLGDIRLTGARKTLIGD